jgi:magnesium-transporting ATPase (P-type)
MGVERLNANEEKRVWLLSLIPTLLILIPFLVQLVIILGRPSLSLWDYWVSWFMPFLLIVPTVLFVSFELLLYSKLKKPAKFQVARMAGRLGLVFTSVIVASATAFVSSNWIAPATGSRSATLSWLFLTLFVLAGIAYATRGIFRKIERGEQQALAFPPAP